MLKSFIKIGFQCCDFITKNLNNSRGSKLRITFLVFCSQMEMTKMEDMRTLACDSAENLFVTHCDCGAA